MGNTSCCEKRDDKQISKALSDQGKKLEGIDEEFDSVLENISEFMRDKQRLER